MRRPPLATVVLAAALFSTACEDLPAVPPAPNVLPTASFFHNPVAPIYAGVTPVTFNAVASRDTDGQIASYVWNFGDRTAAVTTDTPTVSHVFPDTDARCVEVNYAVQLTVIDDTGDPGYANQTVRVIEEPTPGTRACQ